MCLPQLARPLRSKSQQRSGASPLARGGALRTTRSTASDLTKTFPASTSTCSGVACLAACLAAKCDVGEGVGAGASTSVLMSVGSLPIERMIACPAVPCSAANLNLPLGSRAMTKFTKPLHRLQTPSNSRTCRESTSESGRVHNQSLWHKWVRSFYSWPPLRILTFSSLRRPLSLRSSLSSSRRGLCLSRRSAPHSLALCLGMPLLARQDLAEAEKASMRQGRNTAASFQPPSPVFVGETHL
jgi:hypothetical protein